MKHILLLITVLFISCTSDEGQSTEDVELIGKWQLIEQLVDPGDGSGTFQPIISVRTIEFFKDGAIEINGELCIISSEIGDMEAGYYKLITDSDTQYDGEITPNICSSRSARVYFDLPVSGNLILWYQCIESCAQKFEKIK